MHVLPELEALEAEFPEYLVVVGVHSAKFPNEREADSLREAVERHHLTHPVVNDAEFRIWQAYGVHAWPTLVLIDPEGYAVGAVSGEGHRPMLSQVIAGLIAEHRAKGTLREGRPFLLRRSAAPAEGLLAYPGKVLADAAGSRLFIADTGHHRILIAEQTGTILAVAGTGEVGDEDGPFDRARFHHPHGLASDGEGVYVADTGNHRIRRLDLRARTVETVAGSGKPALGPGGPGRGRGVDLNSPWDLVLHNGRLYIAMAGCHQIWAMELRGAALAPFAGSGREELRDGPRLLAGLNQPSGLATDGRVLYVADSEASAIRTVELREEGRVTTLVGEGLFEFGDVDGTGRGVRLQHPLGVAVLDGTIYIADTYNHKVKVLYPALGSVQTLFGTGKPGRELGAAAAFFEPGGLSAVPGRLFIADTNNHRVCVADLNAATVAEVPLRA
ncbi:MAG: alkyl hydroperoxide reductase [Deltaproteobacteria bacterium]|nr:alkyl hydroperoxide reductase [Deltaproteobacteria bacterium]